MRSRLLSALQSMMGELLAKTRLRVIKLVEAAGMPVEFLGCDNSSEQTKAYHAIIAYVVTGAA